MAKDFNVISGLLTIKKCEGDRIFASFGSIHKSFFWKGGLVVGQQYEFSGTLYSKQSGDRWFENIKIELVVPVGGVKND